MAEKSIDEFLVDNHDAILVAVQSRVSGNETMGRIANQREMRESDLTSQVLGFFLQAVRTDLELGSTVALEQSIQWLVRFRSGHELPFDDSMVMSLFDHISEEIDARLDSEALREDYADYRQKVTELIIAAFPK